MGTTSVTLLELIDTSFSEDDLKTLCFALDIDFERLPSNQNKQGKARDLILLCTRENRLPELIAYCRTARPHVNWPALPRKPGGPPQPEPPLIPISAGPFLMGSLPGDDIPAEELPQHEVILPAYSIGRTPITNAEYARFLKQARYSLPPSWLRASPPPGKAEHPVVGLSWYDALAYCGWLEAQTGRPYRLPAEAEWEKAARGPDGRLYPWGNEWRDGLCNHNGDALTHVFAYEAGASPFDCLDMVGNTREWTSTLWGEDYRRPDFPYPYDANDGREDAGAAATVYRIERGSAFNEPAGRHRCAARGWYAPDNKDRRRGFRVALSG